MPRIRAAQFETPAPGTRRAVPPRFAKLLLVQAVFAVLTLATHLAFKLGHRLDGDALLFPRQGDLAAEFAAPLALLSALYFGYAGVLRVYTRVVTLANVLIAKTLLNALSDVSRKGVAPATAFSRPFVAYAAFTMVGMIASMSGVYLARRESAQMRALATPAAAEDGRKKKS